MPHLVLIHGMFCTPSVWGHFAKLFAAEGFTVHAPALRHHDVDPEGEAPDQLGTVSVRDYVDDIAALIATLPEPPVLVGHSMGGLIAQLLAARGLARAAVLLTPAPPAWVPNMHWSVLRTFAPALLRPGFWRRPVRRPFAAVRRTILPLLSEAEAQRVYRDMVWESGRAIAEIGLWFLDPGRATWVSSDNVRCPLYVLAGRQDPVTPAATVRRVARRYDNAVFVELPHHAHWVLGEPGWELIARDVIRWIRQQP